MIRQYTAKEEKYGVLQDKLRHMGKNVPEAFRDANVLAPLLPTLEDRTDVFEVGCGVMKQLQRDACLMYLHGIAVEPTYYPDLAT